MTTSQTVIESPRDSSHVESQGPFHRVIVQRDAFLCLPSALFDNTSSEARDHLGSIRTNFDLKLITANERTFLSWLRLSIVLSIVGVGIASSFGADVQL